ncbi:prepilin-type N-terminal cleavage/methylation domain-containing protein [Cellulomonas sp. zg-ZUI222]|uniref:PulJ/GspJ family protein n=1 Tax=Cellulomonas TaxID=1707 RepID=UPI001A947909|nr:MULTISPECIES: prepilin-type N-terminal cleavage/methylation domain-containing protein [Cellulomonas]MBO0900374.1 prepilin-type N-terminal cleavage/methylation domain-containing protein [Cellulomonas sp. zg-ZUI22]MBO0922796.1 prepilin-type N-terminal cleavage/methylation domain-containing protein [Cellulomonas wangleii]
MLTWWHRWQRARSGDAGMGLPELLVAMMIFALVSTGLAYSLISTLSLTRDARARAVAANLAAEEIDLARDAADLFAMLDETRTVHLNGDEYTVNRTTQWVSDPGAEFTCGAGTGSGSLRYKRVNVTVTWGGMRDGVNPARSDTILTPDDHINDPTKGTILVSVLRADGTGNAGVAVTASPGVGSVISPTDSQGCTYILKVNPGTYTVTVQRAEHVNDAQLAAPTQSVVVAAGSTASVGFQLDEVATFTATMAPGAPAGTRLPTSTNFRTTFTNTYGNAAVVPFGGPGGTSQTYKLHPFTSGYAPFAGTCDLADPRAWPEDTSGPVPLVGTLPDPVAAPPGGTAAMSVPMGVVRVTPGGGRWLHATSEDPGCAVTYSFGEVLTGSGVSIALPYGSWRLQQSSSSSGTKSNISASQIVVPAPAVPERTTVAGSVVTFDPRTAVLP